MYRIGLTGGIASGKSTVAKLLQEMGLPVISLDQISREIMLPGGPGYREVLAHFGQTIVAPGGEIDRKVLGDIIFTDPAKRKLLESITHPLILQRMEDQITAYETEGARAVLVEVPLLIEVGMMEEFDEVWLVYVDEATQIERLKSRDLLDQAGAMARMQAQMSMEVKKQYADRIILNTGNKEELTAQLAQVWRELQCKELL